jgi:aminoglycoside phosphotransferase (APT) family kinase protein
MSDMAGAGTPEGAGAVREEDSFDVGAVAAWLRENAAEPFRGDLDGTPEVRQFAGGASNLTYLLRYPGNDLILRRAPRGTKARGAHDMGREHRIQAALRPVFPYVPAMVAFCDDVEVVGAEFYVMERIDGVVPRGDMRPDAVTPEQARGMCLAMVDVLVELHSVDPVAAGLESLGKGHGYVRRQVEGWSSRYRDARTDDAPDFEATMAWLGEHQPEDVRNCVIHNDFKMDNLVFDRADPTKVVGVLDWEMATLGDPLMDLGGNLAFWVEAEDDAGFQRFRRVPTHLPGMITRTEFVERYCERMGLDVTPEQWRFYEIFGLFRLAVITQQIYYRWFHGQTTNELFAHFGPAVHVADARIKERLGWR